MTARAPLGAVCLLVSSLAAGEPVLRPGESLALPISTDPGAVTTALLDADGLLVLEARSLDLNVAIRVLPLDGAGPIAEDDDGLAGTDARVVVQPPAPARYRVEVRAADRDEEGRGEVVLEARAGGREALSGDARAQADDAYWAAVAARHPVRGALGASALAYARGRVDDALARAREAVSAAEGRPELGVALGNLGLMEYLHGDLAGARATLDRSVALLEARHGGQDLRVATSLSTLGIVLEDSAELPAARAALERSVAIREARLGAGATETINATSNLAGVLLSLGDGEAALASYRRVLAAYEAAMPGSPRLATPLNNVAFALKKLGRTGEAIPYYERSLALRKAKLGPEHPLTALSLQNLGTALHDAGQSERGLALIREALALRETILPPDHPDLATTGGNLARVLHDLGRDEEALPAIERALAIRRPKLGDAHPDTWKHELLRARILAALGRGAEALDLALAAEAAGREDARAVVRFLPERLALRYADRRPDGVPVALEAALAPSAPADAPARLWDQVVRSRALVLDEMARRLASLRGTESPEARAARERLEAAAERWGRAVSGGGKGAAEAIAEAARDREAAERALAEASLPYRRERASREVGLAEVVGALPEGAALVSYLRADTAYAALVKPPGGPAAVVRLGEAKTIDDAVAAWRKAVVAGEDGRAQGAALRRAVWDPVAARLAGAARVVLVPDGALHLVSFAALPAEGGGDAYLVETGPTLALLSTERDLVPSGDPARAARPFLALGGPAFDEAGAGGPAVAAAYRGAPASCEGFRGARFDPLPHAAREAEEAARLAGDPARVLTGREATEDAFKALAPGSRAVHLATHGFALGEGCAGTGEPPLRLSGLALAGANRRGAGSPTNGEDGILTAEEIAALDLSGLSWVALSACETGVGGIASGEGVLGLRRAFAVAGAHTLVMTLWPVDDRAARRWMKAAYAARFGRGEDAAAAARAASLEVLRERRSRKLDTSPLHWGGFVAAGR